MSLTAEPLSARLLSEIDRVLVSASDSLAHPRRGLREGIHQARKKFKEARAMVRLAASLPVLAGVEDRVLRDAGRRLSEARDAAALLECVDSERAAIEGRTSRTAVAAIERALRSRERLAIGSPSLESARGEICEEIAMARARISSWPLPDLGAETVIPGFGETYRRTRKAYERAGEVPSPLNFHAWRKEVKRWWHQVQLVQKLGGLPLRAQEKLLKRLSGFLGKHHDLEMLRHFVEVEMASRPRVAAAVVALAVERQEKLASDALRLGGLLFRDSPRQLESSVRTMWKLAASEESEFRIQNSE